MGKKYRNPPIIEVLCEFRFEPGEPWDLAIPGLVYEKIQADFPIRRQAKAFEINVTAGPGGIGQQVLTTDRMQFLRKDEKALVQVGTNLLAVNHLKPYPTWQGFVPLIRQGFDAYLAVGKPKDLQRVGLRYINRIEMPGRQVELEDYFEFRPFMGARLPQGYGPFIVGVEIPFEDSRDVLRLQLASATVVVSDTVAVMLDLDYFLAQAGGVPKEEVFQWIEAAHDRVEAVFEACITDQLRQMFEEVTGK